MTFIDECTLRLSAGRGGDGAIAFRREKFVPFGGPAGGDGGRGGDIVVVADPGATTLEGLMHLRVVRAESGTNGGGRDCHGRGGRDIELKVPLGTVLYDGETQASIGEITHPEDRLVVARGGRGGRGNKHFTTSVEQAPRRAEEGRTGEERTVRLELKVMADVGLLGFPNVGKSTLISSCSRARPKIAEYPFTTLEPHLGVVTLGDERRGDALSFVLADIPGLIPGASEGAGLGFRFLRHLERTRVLLHLITLTEEPERDPLKDYWTVRGELERFNPDLAKRPEIIALSKADLPDVREAYGELQETFGKHGLDLHLISSVTHEGVEAVLRVAARALQQHT